MNRLDSNAHRAALYRPALERKVQQLAALSRLEVRQQRARPIADALRAWMTEQRAHESEGLANAKALDYSLRRWAALMRYLDDPHIPGPTALYRLQKRPNVELQPNLSAITIVNLHKRETFIVAVYDCR
jgi:Transposase IS66 family